MVEQSTSTAIVVATPKQPTDLLLRQANAVLQMKRLFKKDVHYGPPYPGSKKDTLLKPGAELLARRFGIYPHYEAIKEILQINPLNLDQSVIVYIYRCQMIDIQTGVVVGEAFGACSSLEDKYRQRTAKRECPACGGGVLRSKWPETLPEEQREWYCKDCKKKFAATASEIVSQVLGTVVNPNPLNELNTVIKIAQKRAMVSSVIVATAASSYFAPGDAEVMDAYISASDDDTDMVEGEWAEVADDIPSSFPEDQPAGQGAAQPKAPPPPKSKVTQDDSRVWLKAKDIKEFVDYSLSKLSITAADLKRYLGIDDLQDLSEKGWGKFKTDAEFKALVKDGFEADMKKLAEDQKPATPKTGTPASPFGTKAKAPHQWTDAEIDELETYVANHWYDIKNSTPMSSLPVLESLSLTTWKDTPNPQTAKGMIVSYMVQNTVAIIANKAKYVKAGKGGYAALSNGDCVVRLYGRDSIRKQGEDWETYVDAWEPNEEYVFAEDDMPNLIVEWEAKKDDKGDTSYNNALLVMPELDSMLKNTDF